MSNLPNELKYASSHEWARLEDDGTVTVGITDHAQQALGDVVFVEIETEDEDLDSAAVFGTVEAVKTVSDLFMPLAGKVIEVNAALEGDPELVNKDPYGDGWMIKLKCSDLSQAENLMSADDYKTLVGA